MTFVPRFVTGLAALSLSTASLCADASTSRIDDDATFATWLEVKQSQTDPEVYEVDAGRTFAPERVREVRVWVDTGGLFRFDNACEDGDASGCVDFISFEDIRKNEVFKGQTKYPSTTIIEGVDNGEVFVFRDTDSGDEIKRVKSALLDGKFKVRVTASSPNEYSLKRVHVSVHFRPARKR